MIALFFVIHKKDMNRIVYPIQNILIFCVLCSCKYACFKVKLRLQKSKN